MNRKLLYRVTFDVEVDVSDGKGIETIDSMRERIRKAVEEDKRCKCVERKGKEGSNDGIS